MNINEMKKILLTAQKQLDSAPKEVLWMSKSRNSFQYYSYDGTKRYITSEEAKPLAQKRYNELVLKELTKQIKIYTEFNKQFNENVLEELFDNLPEAIRVLVEPHNKTYKQYGEEWLRKDYRPKSIKDGTVTYLTENGERVRSKSEVIIANKLKSLGLFYRYESPKYIKDFGNFYPDFTVLSPKDRSEVIIEHFGLMDNPEYATNFVSKVLLYSRADIFPGHGLICFFETNENPLNIKYVDKVLRRTFL